MKTILIVGIGAGNPEHITIQAINALNRADVLFIPDKGASKADLADLRREIIARYVTNPASRTLGYAVPRRDASNPDYGAGVDDWHAALAERFAGLLSEVPDNGACAFLVWGDPGLYDSTIRIVERLRQTHPVSVEIMPGITSVQALTAAHGIALNRIGEPVQITTGRKLGTVADDTIVMLNGQTAFTEADPDLEIFWGAYLGTPDEITISGRLGDVASQIVETRQTARARHGWIMDTYLLRKRD
ncbi:precorrin-6A synthase (deacetylating) [Devosia neptuniae]|jgi:precorrin-6A synthase|uniref:precorrin-6A synthase (deacetylating) n=1 Tax=Devosia TaxID=46913 RepID=UPI0022B02028|nr:precorrin-6A synthase (deacetylating) [Devosia neptuniae]MCZ4344781.1 precorrin-6A synthase (deacetylating) [Devosia neptuniae]|tara:strand:+ start:541 stop:1275 length:735 start_codon:yes stop_codon:yes gene_type:complete